MSEKNKRKWIDCTRKLFIIIEIYTVYYTIFFQNKNILTILLFILYKWLSNVANYIKTEKIKKKKCLCREKENDW